MAKLSKADKIKRAFFTDTDLTLEDTQKIVKEALKDADYGEFYQETIESESISKSKGEFRSISFGNNSGGFGFRIGQHQNVSYSYANRFDRKTLENAADETRKVLKTGLKKQCLSVKF